MGAHSILVTGATGRQGMALIHALRPTTSDSEHEFHILALTRKASSPAAKKLSEEKHVTVVEGNLDSPDSTKKIFEDAKEKGEGVWGVFCVLAFPGLGANADGEEKQGKTLADIALEFGVSLFVFSSAERGGESNDDNAKLDRMAKVNIERHIRELGAKGLPWTILRPGFFMENYEGTIGSITVAVLREGLKPSTTIQLIAVDDIGHVAAAVFKNPSQYESQILSVVGERSTMKDQEVAWKNATGTSIPAIPRFLARFLISKNGHTQDLIADMERVHNVRTSGENPDGEKQREAARRAYPEIKTFQAWAEQKRGKPSQRKQNWNQVSILRLLTGKQ